MNASARVAAAVLFALGLARHAEAAPLRTFQSADASRWKMIQSARLTSDGQRLVYLLEPVPGQVLEYLGVEQKGESMLVVRDTHSTRERRYPAGSAGSGMFGISGQDRHAGFIRAAAGGGTFVSIEIATGKARDVAAASRFFFVGRDREAVLLEYSPPGAAEKTLSLRNEDGTERVSVEGVSSYSVSGDGMLLVAAAGGGVRRYDLQTGTAVELAPAQQADYSQWQFSPSNRSVVVLRTEPGREPQIAVFGGLDSKAPALKIYAADAWPAFPAKTTIAGSFVWRADESGLMFNFQRPRAQSAANGFPVAIWNSRSEALPAEIAWQNMRNARRADLGFLTLADGKALPLTDGFLEDVQPASRGNYVMGYSDARFGWRGSYNDRAGRRDYYLVDIRTGERSELVTDLQVYSRGNRGIPQLSPDGGFAVWIDNAGDFIACELATRKTVSLTGALPVRFHSPENDPRTSRKLVDSGFAIWGIQGWVPERDSVLVSDWFDVWELPMRGGTPRNLTVDGRTRGVRYGLNYLTVETSPAARSFAYPLAKELAMRDGSLPVPPDAVWYFDAWNTVTAEQGFARLARGAQRARDLVWDAAETEYIKAARADVWVAQRQTSVDATDHYLLDCGFKRTRRLTDSNPQQREFAWSPGSKYLTYRTSRGDTRNAALFLPAGYDRGKRYPTVIFIYQQTSHLMHVYVPFDAEHYPWLNEGYAVLMPDIIPRPDEPGKAAAESVAAAIDAGAEAGVVDRDRVGLHGHSYGGFETYYIATRTSLVKAAVPYAGMTDLITDGNVVYNDIYDGRAIGARTNSALVGFSQPFLTPPWWKNMDAYTENSALYHLSELKTPMLMVHGDKDRAVRFANAEVFFNSVRLAGNPNVVLLHYPGEGHDMSVPAMRDMNARMLQFFDHFLKGKPAPEWWASGQSYVAGTAPK